MPEPTPPAVFDALDALLDVTCAAPFETLSWRRLHSFCSDLNVELELRGRSTLALRVLRELGVLREHLSKLPNRTSRRVASDLRNAVADLKATLGSLDRFRNMIDAPSNRSQVASDTSKVSPIAKGDSLSTISDEAHLSSTSIAEKFALPAEALRKRLDRWRASTQDGWIENADPKTREPKYLYRVGSVKSIIQEMRASGETSVT